LEPLNEKLKDSSESIVAMKAKLVIIIAVNFDYSLVKGAKFKITSDFNLEGQELRDLVVFVQLPTASLTKPS